MLNYAYFFNLNLLTFIEYFLLHYFYALDLIINCSLPPTHEHFPNPTLISFHSDLNHLSIQPNFYHCYFYSPDLPLSKNIHCLNFNF